MKNVPMTLNTSERPLVQSPPTVGFAAALNAVPSVKPGETEREEGEGREGGGREEGGREMRERDEGGRERSTLHGTFMFVHRSTYI